MAIDVKMIQSFVWQIVKFSMNICYRIVQKHPFVSSVVLLFFLLYLFLPPVFFYLIYSSPVIFCIYVKLKLREFKHDKRVDEKLSVESKYLAAYDDDAVVVSRNDNKPVTHDEQMRRRKNVNKEFDGKSSNKETGMTLDTTPVDASIVGSQNVITEEMGIASLDHGESSSSWNVSGVDNIQALDQPDKGLDSQSKLDSLFKQDLVEQTENGNAAAAAGGREAEEESSDEEETRQDGKNAVEWTADDQQNLIDLGDSELERNKRLESLIARRRARKLFKMAIEKRLMELGSGSQMPPLSIVRNNILLNIPDNQDYVEGIQFPDSAPSVLLPARNPFDIPYDPYEERPNLTGDSFHEEFAIHQRELPFCRHESFFLGPSFSLESQQDQHEKRTAAGLIFSRHRTVSDMSAHDQLIDDLLDSQEGEAMSRNLSATDLVELGSQSPKESKTSEGSKHGMAGMEGEAIENSADRSEIQMDTDSIRDNSSELCSLASDEASEMSIHANTSSNIGNLVPQVDKHRHNLSDRIKSSLTFTIPEDIALNGHSYDSIPSAFDKPRLDDHFFFRDKGPCHSPGYSIASDLQVEVSELGSPILPTDGTMSPADAASLYDGDFEKDVISGSEEMGGASCHLAGVDENELRSREVNEVSVNDILGAGISAMKQNLESRIASSSRTKMHEEDDTHSKHPNNKVSENVQQVLEEVPMFSNYSHSLPPQIPHKKSPGMKELVSHPPSEVSSKEPEEVSIPAAGEPAAVNATPEVDDQVMDARNEKDNLKSSEEMGGGGSKISTNKEAIMDLFQPAENITSASSNHIEQICDKPAEQETMIQPEGDPPKLNELEEVGSSSMKTEAQDEQSATEAGVSGVIRSFDNPNMSPALLQILVTDQISTISSSYSSPRSVLPGKNRRLSSASFDQQIPIQNDEPQSNLDDMVRNNSMDDMSTENSQHLELSAEVVEGTSEPQINLQATAILSKSIEGCPSKSEENAAESNAPGNMMKEDVEPHREADLTNSINHSLENEKEDKGQTVIGTEGESKNVIDDEAAIELSVPAAAETVVEMEPSDPLSQKPTAEAGVMHDVNEKVADDTSNVKSLIDQENGSDQLKIIENDKHEPEYAKVVVEQSRPRESEFKEASNNEMNAAE